MCIMKLERKPRHGSLIQISLATLHSYQMQLMLSAEEGKTIILSSHFSEIAQIIDKFVSKFLFGEDINFEEAKNCIVLNNVSIFNFIVEEVRKSILLKVSESKICYASYIIRTRYVMTVWSQFNVNDGLF